MYFYLEMFNFYQLEIDTMVKYLSIDIIDITYSHIKENNN